MDEGNQGPLPANDIPMALVGARELAALQARWDEYQAVAIDLRGPGKADPVLALRRMGAVVRAVGDLVATSRTCRPEE
jgi:hypothetical protein